ncbi:polysaccharide deacetylase family protein [Desulfocicer vacuolatum]|uniref:polysaccharide deacetylase family protein n=1 Tax=Desulfocicer vacuolatum TaxID=2298 RepID=UPI0014820C74|nr:polysaccharide deacetylase family protein [Desulfocicer vacuolatum]
MKQGGLILMYHRVLPAGWKGMHLIQPGMYVSTDTFEREMKLLKTKFNVISLGSMLDYLKTERSLSRCCVITFDDGWQDTFTHAFPILERYKLPATVFLTSGYMNTDRRFWPDELAACLGEWFSRGRGDALLPMGVKRILEKEGVTSHQSPTFIIDRAIGGFKKISETSRDTLLLELKEIFPNRIDDRVMMTWQEVDTMTATGRIDLGAHTVSHCLLDQIPPWEAKKEILQSKQEIESRLNRSVDYFAYPNGNFTPEISDLVREAGFAAAVTTRRGWVHAGQDLFELPRNGIHNDVGKTDALFMWRLLIR